MQKTYTQLCGILGILYCGAVVGAEANKELVESLVKQQAAATEAIKSVQVEYSYKVEGTAEPIHGIDGKVAIAGGREIKSGTIKLWRQGNCKRVYHQFQREFPERGALMRETEELIFTPAQYLQYLESVNGVFLHHLNPQQPPEAAITARRDSTPWPDLFSYGLAQGRTQLLHVYEDSQRRSSGTYQHEWLVTGGNETPYKLETMISGNDQPRWKRRDVVINQHCGFLVTENRSFDKQGNLKFGTTVTPHEVTSQIWVPGTVKHVDKVNGWTIEVSLKHIEVNNSIPEETFSLAAMTFDPERTILKETFPNGSDVTKALYEGVWLPKEQWPEAVRHRIQNLPRNIPASGGFGGIWIRSGAVE